MWANKTPERGINPLAFVQVLSTWPPEPLRFPLKKDTNMNNSPVSFSFHETHNVRVHVIDSAPWFCLKDVSEVLSIANSRDLMAKQLDKEGVDKIYTLTEGGKQQLFFVNEPNLYRVIFRSNKPEAKQFQDWVFNEVLPTIRKTGSYHSVPVSEPLSNKQQEQVKRLVWCASHNMKFSQSWSSAIWKTLRSVTGRPSPQPFTIDDIPAINQEIERIMKITAATHNAMYDFEKQVIRLAVRKRQDIDPILNDMRLELLEIQKRESEGKLMLEKWDKIEMSRLVV